MNRDKNFRVKRARHDFKEYWKDLSMQLNIINYISTVVV